METELAERLSARDRLLAAAVTLVRRNGFGSTSVDALCCEAGVTKGAFFHHFRSKEALGVAAADYWSATTGALFAAGDWHAHADPVARVLGYIDFRAQLITGNISEFTCFAGTMAQEIHHSSLALREACRNSIHGHAKTLEDDLAGAIIARHVHGVTAASLALHIQAVLQGGFILSKVSSDTAPALANIEHLRRYLSLLFGEGQQQCLT